MKKTKLLALTLVVALMMMGAGYAYWTEALTIKTTVDTGDLNVVFNEPANVLNESIYQPNADCSVYEGGKGMSINFLEVYPGLKNTIEFTLENHGTLGAYVDEFRFAPNSDRATYAKLDQILVNSVTVGNATTGFSGTLKDALDYLSTGNGIFVDTTLDKGSNVYTPGSVKVTLELEFNPDADSVTLPENNLFGIDILATVYQFNAR